MLRGVAALTEGEGVSHDIRVHDQLLKATHVSVDSHVLGGGSVCVGRSNGSGGCSRLLGLLHWTQLPGHLGGGTESWLQASLRPPGAQVLLSKKAARKMMQKRVDMASPILLSPLLLGNAAQYLLQLEEKSCNQHCRSTSLASTVHVQDTKGCGSMQSQRLYLVVVRVLYGTFSTHVTRDLITTINPNNTLPYGTHCVQHLHDTYAHAALNTTTYYCRHSGRHS